MSLENCGGVSCKRMNEKAVIGLQRSTIRSRFSGDSASHGLTNPTGGKYQPVVLGAPDSAVRQKKNQEPGNDQVRHTRDTEVHKA